VTPDEVARLAELAGLAVPEEDLAPLAEALAAQAELVAPLLDVDAEPATDFDPRWDE
jgi:Asp-tRNA(Asn)/Glu-tRNA(Gln) amidotransferase C subunit